MNLIAAKAFLRAGHEVAAVEALIKPSNDPVPDDLGIKLYPRVEGDNPLGTETLRHAYEDFSPDLVYLTGEPGTAVAYTMHLPFNAEFLAYLYIEGEPLVNARWRNVLSNIDVIAPTEYGARIVAQSTGNDTPWVYSGVDHDVFQVTGRRDEIRERLGVEDKFLLMCVAQNVRRKQIPRLFEAMAILKYKYNRRDVALYLHSVPFQFHWLDGWNLPEVIRSYSLEDDVYFHPKLDTLQAAVPDRTDDPSDPGLVEMYNAADLFVLPSQVEGFGLPIAEAMACGLPVAVTKYAAGWEVASPAGRGLPIHDWEIHKSGTRYANVDPAGTANLINRLMRGPKELTRMRESGLARVQDFQWSKFEEAIVSEAERIFEHGGKARNRAVEEEDTAATEGKEADGLRESEAQED